MKKLLLILPILALMGIGCGSNQPAAEQNQPAAEPAGQPQASAPAAETATEDNDAAKIYKSAFGYEFAYAAGYILEADDPKKISLRNKNNNTADAYGHKGPADITIEYFENLAQLPYYKAGLKDANDYVAQGGANNEMNNISSYRNKNGALVYFFTDLGIMPVYTELFPYQNHYYQISFAKKGTADKLSADEKQVQESFKFTK